MDEKDKKVEENKPEVTTPPKDEGIQSETESLIEQSNKAAERNEKVLADLRKENDRIEKLKIQEQLAGKGQAGQSIQQIPKLSKEEQASQNRIKEVGNATGANWAKNMEEKKDEK